MSKRHRILSFAVLLLALSTAWGQDSSQDSPAQTQDTNGVPAATPQQPVPAFGQDNPTPSITENPPISGVDMPNLEPHAAPLSYLQPALHFSESADSNIQDALGGTQLNSISRALGSVELQRLWSHYDLSLGYLGGVAYYNVTGLGFKQIEELGIDQKITWKRGQLGVRDSFSYQPEGNFGSAYGAVGTTGAGVSGLAFFGGQGLGELGQVPRVMNLSLVDVVESLTPKSSLTATAGYGFVHFLGNEFSGSSFIGNSQLTAEVGYNRILGPHDQGALMYAYQGFDFSTGVAFHSHVVQVMWGHRISGRMDFLVGAGPHLTFIDNLLTAITNPGPGNMIPPCIIGGSLSSPVLECPENDRRLSSAGQASLRYRFPKFYTNLSYSHYLTSGSGFFAGAESDIVRLTAGRPLGRIWSVTADIGYSRNSRVASLTAAESATCTMSATNPNPPPCPGTVADIYQYGFAGVGVHRMFGRDWHAYASYQFNYLTFDSSYCQAMAAGAAPTPCNRISQRNVGTIGLDWTPRPTRLD